MVTVAASLAKALLVAFVRVVHYAVWITADPNVQRHVPVKVKVGVAAEPTFRPHWPGVAMSGLETGTALTGPNALVNTGRGKEPLCRYARRHQPFLI